MGGRPHPHSEIGYFPPSTVCPTWTYLELSPLNISPPTPGCLHLQTPLWVHYWLTHSFTLFHWFTVSDIYIHNTWYITQYITHWHYSHHPHYSFTLLTHYITLITVTCMEAPDRLEYTVSCGSFFWKSKKKYPNLTLYLPDISLWNADILTMLWMC